MILYEKRASLSEVRSDKEQVAMDKWISYGIPDEAMIFIEEKSFKTTFWVLSSNQEDIQFSRDFGKPIKSSLWSNSFWTWETSTSRLVIVDLFFMKACWKGEIIITYYYTF